MQYLSTKFILEISFKDISKFRKILDILVMPGPVSVYGKHAAARNQSEDYRFYISVGVTKAITELNNGRQFINCKWRNWIRL